MKNNRFIAAYIVVLILQLILTRYCQMGSVVYICLLPALMLSLPTTWRTSVSLVLAFVSGFLVDALADGPLGLNTIAILPCALLQKPIIKFFIDDILVERGYAFSFRQYGYVKIGVALIVEEFMFFIVYVVFDCAGVVSFGSCFVKVLVSTLVSLVFGMVATGVLSPRERR